MICFATFTKVWISIILSAYYVYFFEFKPELPTNFCTFHWIDWWLKTKRQMSDKVFFCCDFKLKREAARLSFSFSFFRFWWRQKTFVYIWCLVFGISSHRPIQWKEHFTVWYLLSIIFLVLPNVCVQDKRPVKCCHFLYTLPLHISSN